MVTPDKDQNGDYVLYDKGKNIGHATMQIFQGCLVVSSIVPILTKMVAAAAKDGVPLRLASGYRVFSKQVGLRRQNVIDKSKAGDDDYIYNADSSKFFPVTAKPGWSNHQDGGAYDFKTKDDLSTPENEALAYAWLVKNALNFGFIRTVPSERWHWEYRPGQDKFAGVPKNHPTWDGLV